MALTLIVRSGDLSPSPELTFDAPRIVIGRRAGADLRLPDPSVSPRHASLRQRGSEYVVIDEGSENGTFVGDTELGPQASHTLKSGDLLRFGRVWIEVKINSTAPVSPPGVGNEVASRLVERALEADERPHAARIVVFKGPLMGQTLDVALERRVLIGSERAADLCLPDDKGPQATVEISRRTAGELSVVRRGSDGMARLKSRVLKAGVSCTWALGSVLELGENRLHYDDPVDVALRELEQSPTERLGPRDVVAPPNGARPDASQVVAAKIAPPPAAPAQSARAPRPRLMLSGTSRSSAPTRGFGPAEIVIALLCVGVLCVSLWAITWLSHLPAQSSGIGP